MTMADVRIEYHPTIYIFHRLRCLGGSGGGGGSTAVQRVVVILVTVEHLDVQLWSTYQGRFLRRDGLELVEGLS